MGFLRLTSSRDVRGDGIMGLWAINPLAYYLLGYPGITISIKIKVTRVAA